MAAASWVFLRPDLGGGQEFSGSQEVQHWPGQVGPGYVEPAAKKAKKEGSEKAKKGMVMVEGSA